MSSRTSLGIRNGQISLLYYVVSMLMGFASRKVFLDGLGTELMGLNTTAQNLLGILNLSELGIGTAVAYLLYLPIRQKEHRRIREIVAIQGWLYRRIAGTITVGSIILMGSFPLIFAKTEVPMGYAYATFAVFLFSSLLTYFFNYKQILFSASQQGYKVILHYQSIMLLRSLAQIAAVLWLPCPYAWWLGLHVLFACVATWNLHRAVGRSFPFLTLGWKDGKQLSPQYPHLHVKIKQAFFHHVASFALTQSSPLIIFAYTSLTSVALYTNYQLISTTIIGLVHALFSGIHAGVGNLVAEGDRMHAIKVFEELFSLRFFTACVCCFGFIELTEPFIRIWIGDTYVLPHSTLLLMAGILYILISRHAVETFIAAQGMYQDIAAPVLESVLNIGLSCWFGYLWGIDGILTGVLVSLVIVVLGWKPYFLLRYGFDASLGSYYRMYLIHLACLGIAIPLTGLLMGILPLPAMDSYLTWTITGGIQVLLFASTLCLLLYLCTMGMHRFIQRIKSIN